MAGVWYLKSVVATAGKINATNNHKTNATDIACSPNTLSRNYFHRKPVSLSDSRILLLCCVFIIVMDFFLSCLVFTSLCPGQDTELVSVSYLDLPFAFVVSRETSYFIMNLRSAELVMCLLAKLEVIWKMFLRASCLNLQCWVLPSSSSRLKITSLIKYTCLLYW